MKDASGQDKQMKYGVIQVVVSHKEWHTTGIANAAKYKEIHRGLW